MDTLHPAANLPRTVWEEVARSRWGSYMSELERSLILEGAQLCQTPAHALDVGCEGGRWSKMLADMGWSMACVDVNPKTLAICQARIPAAQCFLTNRENRSLAFSTSSFELLLCIEVAPVIDSDWFVSEAARVLKPGGILVGVTWNMVSWRGMLSRLTHALGRETRGDYYRRAYSVFRGDLRRGGFEMLHEEGFCWGPFGRASNSPLVPLFTRAERVLQLRRLPAISPWVAFIARRR